jgi:dihydrolipoamide dehydrogenase
MPATAPDDAATDHLATDHLDVAILGAGTAAESLVGSLHGSGLSIVVFEPGRVGGICPFEACVPSKSMLHDAAAGTEWDAAVARRAELTHHLDDDAHADELTSRGATIVRAPARLVGADAIEAGGRRYTADHVVIATGGRPVVPDIDGLDQIDDLVWTSGDALTDDRRPDRVLIVGGGVIGCELAHVYAGFGSSVTLVEPAACLFADLAPEVCDAITAVIEDRVDELRLGTRPVSGRRHGTRAAIRFDDGVEQRFDRVVIATGRRPALSGLGLGSIGLDPDRPLPVGDTGRVACAGSVWAIGDVAGREQYTHAAGHHGSVVADQLAGRGTRRFDDVVSASCMFTSPPMFTVGPTHAATVDDDDVVWDVGDLDGVVRANTDDAHGVLAVAGSRSTRRLVAAHGIGPRFDELVHAIVFAVDGAIPIDRLVQSMVPFPTMGNALQQRLLALRDAL